MTTASAKRRPGGFTLVELLVVMAVIGLLIAILSPAVMHSRAIARRTQCQSQMKQIGLALTNYVDIQGSRGVFPWAAILPTVAPERPSLVEVLGPHIEHSEGVFACPDDRTYFQKEGLSYEYPALRLSGRNMLQVRRRNSNGDLYPSSEVLILYDFDDFHGKPKMTGSRNALYLDGHVEGL